MPCALLCAATLGGTAAHARTGQFPANGSNNGQGTLLFVGDSLTVGADAFGSLASRITATGVWPLVNMDARVGRTASAGATTVKNRLTKRTTAVVIALGTNDMLSKPEPWYPGWVIDKVMNQTKGRPVLWFTVRFSDSSRRDWRTRAARFNRALMSARDRWPGLQVADWSSDFVPNKVSRFIADGVHLTVTGYRTRSLYSVRRITEFGRAVVDATTTTTTTSTTTTTTEPLDSVPATTAPPTTDQ